LWIERSEKSITGQAAHATLNVPSTVSMMSSLCATPPLATDAATAGIKAGIRNKERPHAVPIAWLPFAARDGAADSDQDSLRRLHILQACLWQSARLAWSLRAGEELEPQ